MAGFSKPFDNHQIGNNEKKRHRLAFRITVMFQLYNRYFYSEIKTERVFVMSPVRQTANAGVASSQGGVPTTSCVVLSPLKDSCPGERPVNEKKSSAKYALMYFLCISQFSNRTKRQKIKINGEKSVCITPCVKPSTDQCQHCSISRSSYGVSRQNI